MSHSPGKLAALLDSKIPFSVVLAEKEIALETLLQYSVGSVIVLKDARKDRLRLEVAGTEVGQGTTVTVGEALGLRLNEVHPPKNYLDKIV